MMRWILPVLICIPALLKAQSTTNSDQTNLKKFSDGVYFSFEQLNSTKPGLQPAQLSPQGEKNVRLRQWFKTDSLFYYSSGHRFSLPYDSIYALVEDGHIYMQKRGYIHKINIMGSLCYYTESYPVNKTPAPVTIDLAKDVLPRILDFKTGEILDYTTAVMEELLKERDEVLYTEYMALETAKLRRQLLLRYVEKYNDRHPLTEKGPL